MNDLISRQALQDAMYHEAFETDSDMQKWDSGCWIRYKMFENVVEALPSAQPDRKVGKWIDHSDDGYVECPFCRSATNCDDNINELHYCFSCGAKMEVEE